MSADHTPTGAAWPTYDTGVANYTHAIGVLSVNYNNLENKLLDLLKLYDGAPDDVVAFLFEKVPTETRLEWLRRLVKGRKAIGATLSTTILAFSKAYKVCTDNRNLIVHSRISAHFAGDDAIMMSKRVRKHGEERHHDLSLEIIRRVADEIYFWNQFGNHVLWFVRRRQRAARQKKYGRSGVRLIGPTTLPKIFPPPEDLAKRFQN